MRLRTKRIILMGASIAGIALSYCGYGVVEPQTAAGRATFHFAYSFPPTRPAILRFYGWSLREFNGGWLPIPVDEFLSSRLGECRGNHEGRAILNFQISGIYNGWGNGVAHAHDDLKREVIDDLIRRLDTFAPEQALDTVLFIETLRRDTPLGKCGGFRGPSLTPESLATAKEHFRAWWSDGSAWPTNKNKDPLQGTEITFYEGA